MEGKGSRGGGRRFSFQYFLLRNMLQLEQNIVGQNICLFVGFLFAFWLRFCLHLLPLYSSRSASSEGAIECEVNVFLAVQANHKRGNIDQLLAHSADDDELMDADNLRLT